MVDTPVKIMPKPNTLRLLCSFGDRLVHWRLDIASQRLIELGSFVARAKIQYGWVHPSKSLIYLASSDGGGRRGPAGTKHDLVAVNIANSGALEISGPLVELESRPIHVSVDRQGSHALVAFSDPSAIRVYEIKANGHIGGQVFASQGIDTGNYPHQVLVHPNGNIVFSTALGQDPSDNNAEDPGSLNIFDYHAGSLRMTQSVRPNSGYGFGPRHLDIHPNGKWVYVSMERQNEVHFFLFDGKRMSDEAIDPYSLLTRPVDRDVKQKAGAIHIHPNGKYVYAVNRASAARSGENSFVVFSIDEDTGYLK